MKSYKEFITESNKPTYSPKNMIEEICTVMVLLNNEFLDNILDRGLKARYSENSQVFLTDLKNLLLSKNRFKLGRFFEGDCIEDQDVSKINSIFNSIQFDIEKDWDKLSNARTTARAIIDKADPEQKMRPERIKNVYWLGPNKDDEHGEDIIIEDMEGRQYSFYLNKNLALQKSGSFNTFADEFIGIGTEQMFSPDYQRRWDKLVQEWIRVTYESCHKNIQRQIEKFIDVKRIESIGYFNYFDIRHRDPQFRYLGEYMKEFDKNILKFSDLLNEIWKFKDISFMDAERAEKEWSESKIVILNSKILEHLFTTFLLNNKSDEIEKLDNGFKKALGTVKMKLVKVLVEKMGCLERDVFYVGKKGASFHKMPSRGTFRDMYDEMDVLFDYHVKFQYDDDEEEKNDFNMKLKLVHQGDELLNMNIIVKFSSGEFSNKLTAKYKFDIPENFNYKLSQLGEMDEETAEEMGELSEEPVEYDEEGEMGFDEPTTDAPIEEMESQEPEIQDEEDLAI